MVQLLRKDSENHLQENHKNGVLFFTVPAYDKLPFLVHGFSSRIGGVSERELGEMNLSFTRGDDPERVKENFHRMAAAIGFPYERMVFSYQTHTTNVCEVTEKDCGKGYLCERDYKDVDGLVTDVPGVVLTTFYADCVPLFFVDPVHKAIGLSHSGWRGTVNNITGATVRKMKERYGTKPSDLLAAIGPSICQDCYEVGEDVIRQVRDGFPEALWPILYTERRKLQPDASRALDVSAGDEKKYQLNLWECCRQNMLRAGLSAENITITDLCTCCNPDIFFSHRASHGKRGNLAAFLALKE
ncbi:MAG: peptidoglycan editing factor PgeF [Lachnospiraceae bacterium]|nr:peptidoglycan editing factor PgeF [Lachnospiraceae bacterium]